MALHLGHFLCLVSYLVFRHSKQNTWKHFVKMASFFLVLQHGQVSFAWKYKHKIRWLLRFRAKFRSSCQPRTMVTSVANCNTCRHSNKPVRCHVNHSVDWPALSAGKMLGSKWQLFLVLILIGWDKEARGLSAKSQSEQNKTITFETHLKIAPKIENTFLRSIILIKERGARSISEQQTEKNKTISFETHRKSLQVENKFTGKMFARK